ncbi:hypothetical protein C0Q70_03197 [Pomacea canaliculata]|uniref:Uncharacterized protein n=1 Tax=Pomacea canaliculata TaxID=400727 RepID=A0A2T7PS23_POMCA|nr:hypothetical protein C0Q70_03197 [Pomacea canaliculata]
MPDTNLDVLYAQARFFNEAKIEESSIKYGFTALSKSSNGMIGVEKFRMAISWKLTVCVRS